MNNIICSIVGHDLYRKPANKKVEMFPEDKTKAIFTSIIYCKRCGKEFGEKREVANL